MQTEHLFSRNTHNPLKPQHIKISLDTLLYRWYSSLTVAGWLRGRKTVCLCGSCLVVGVRGAQPKRENDMDAMDTADLEHLARILSEAETCETKRRRKEESELVLQSKLQPRKAQAEPVGLFAQTQGQLL